MGRRALVADDEDSIAFLVENLLEREGFSSVIRACDGDEAAMHLVSETTAFDLAVLDVHMPGRPSLVLVKETRDKHPGLALVVLSGRTEDGPKALDAGASAFLAKPFATTRFRDVVRSLLVAGVRRK